MGRRNPNGYGCVTKLSGRRSRPWCVKITTYDSEGQAKQTPIGYAATEEEANILLAEYNNNPWNIDRERVTLLLLYQRWAEIKLPKLGKSNQSSLRAAFKHCSKYYGVKYRSLRSYHMQDCIDNCGKIITVEDHNIMNGLGSAVAEVIAESGKGRLKRIGVQDQYGQSAPYERLLEMNGITVENIVSQAETLLN